ncbi:hypothetical protein VP01_1679g3 [Puccinia sorghi]|uniref:Uncharacterized protein n=1 Tax=Puccinia sorghi TaxID=27349 RepID=A0A0L6VHV1_9BASI|nr:hypothetical protein VP01_1679g3 [Puccinia sorghi]
MSSCTPKSWPISTPCSTTLIQPPLHLPCSSGPPLRNLWTPWHSAGPTCPLKRPPEQLLSAQCPLKPPKPKPPTYSPPALSLLPTEPSKSPEDTFIYLIWSALAFYTPSKASCWFLDQPIILYQHQQQHQQHNEVRNSAKPYMRATHPCLSLFLPHNKSFKHTISLMGLLPYTQSKIRNHQFTLFHPNQRGRDIHKLLSSNISYISFACCECSGKMIENDFWILFLVDWVVKMDLHFTMHSFFFTYLLMHVVNVLFQDIIFLKHNGSGDEFNLLRLFCNIKTNPGKFLKTYIFGAASNAPVPEDGLRVSTEPLGDYPPSAGEMFIAHRKHLMKSYVSGCIVAEKQFFISIIYVDANNPVDLG